MNIVGQEPSRCSGVRCKAATSGYSLLNVTSLFLSTVPREVLSGRLFSLS